MIYIGISLLIGIISIGIALYVRYRIEKDIIIKTLDLEHTKQIWKKHEEFSLELQKYEDQYQEIKEQKQKEIDKLLEM